MSKEVKFSSEIMPIDEIWCLVAVFMCTSEECLLSEAVRMSDVERDGISPENPPRCKCGCVTTLEHMAKYDPASETWN